MLKITRRNYEFLAREAVKHTPCHKVVATLGQDVLTHPSHDNLSNLSPCTHEEADTRMTVHVADVVTIGHASLVIRTVDTDVVVLAITAVNKLQLQELWVAFGTSKNLGYLPAHEYTLALGSAISKALPIFHAFTGSDTTSTFCGHGKKTAWATWESYPEVTDAFLERASGSSDLPEMCLTILERFVVIMYDRTSTLNLVGGKVIYVNYAVKIFSNI